MKVNAKPAGAFVPIATLKTTSHDSAAVLAEIRRIYFTTTRPTIAHDLPHAIDLLKSLPTETDREKATVYMHGLDQMRREWEGDGGGKKRPRKKAAARPTPRRR